VYTCDNGSDMEPICRIEPICNFSTDDEQSKKEQVWESMTKWIPKWIILFELKDIMRSHLMKYWIHINEDLWTSGFGNIVFSRENNTPRMPTYHNKFQFPTFTWIKMYSLIQAIKNKVARRDPLRNATTTNRNYFSVWCKQWKIFVGWFISWCDHPLWSNALK